jgi:hypothetical protein
MHSQSTQQSLNFDILLKQLISWRDIMTAILTQAPWSKIVWR